ncbi:MAG TPA: hypothetical protein VEI82_00240 [Myxococcota bacterium]|nr:hypothetical protein [Myxococcota bacterium]
MGDLESGLLEVISARCGRRDLEYAKRPTPLGGGYWAEIFAFELRDPPRGFGGELILRRMPDPERARRETAVQTALAELGFPTPRVRATGGAGEALNRAFSIMDRAARAPSARAAYTGPAPVDPVRLAWYRALYRVQLLARVEAAAAGVSDAPFLPDSHPYRLMAPRARARLQAALRR